MKECDFCANQVNDDEFICEKCKEMGIVGKCAECDGALFDSDEGSLCADCTSADYDDFVEIDAGHENYNANFKKETMSLIEELGAKEIDEVRILFTQSYPYAVYRDTELNWDKMAETFGLEPDDDKEWNYDCGYGGENFMGWITFKDTSTYMQRKEYDGSEWWEFIKRPTLKDYEREDEQIMKDRREDDEEDLQNEKG